MTQRPDSQTREEQARLEIGRTEVSRGAAWTLVAVGLATLLAVPAVQTACETRDHLTGRRASRWPQCCEIVAAVPRVAAACKGHDGGWISGIERGNAVLLEAIESYEKEMKAGSLLTRYVVPPAQELLAYAGSGNEKAYVGRRGWLFYRPGIDYCTGWGFLDPRQMARRSGGGGRRQPAPQPDPRGAILQFHRQLAQRKIRLVLMPTPDKASIHPEKFSSRFEGRRIGVHNPSYGRFLEELQAEGLLVCDVTGVLAEYRERSGKELYLATDTHWRPEAMELAAAELARLIGEHIELGAAVADGAWRQRTVEVTNLGDIALMLSLPPGQRVFGRESVTIHPLSDAAGRPWQPDPAAEVLVLGDSFANMYSLEMMNWGAAAGLAEQLSFALRRPVDAMLRNGDGAYATRELLSRDLARGEDRLAGKKVVVWQFAARELAVGDWKPLDMAAKPSRTPADGSPPAAGGLIVSGTIAAKSAAPRAGKIPYAHHIFTLDLSDVQAHGGTLTDPKVAVYLFSLRDHRNTPAYSWPVGKQVKLRLLPWRPDYFARYGRINRSETDDVELKHPWWGEVIE